MFLVRSKREALHAWQQKRAKQEMRLREESWCREQGASPLPRFTTEHSQVRTAGKHLGLDLLLYSGI